MKTTKKYLLCTLCFLLVLGTLPIGLFSSLASADVIKTDVAQGVTAVAFGGHQYAVYDLGYTWNEANEFCESLGGHLVTITSQAEQTFIQNLIKDCTKNNYWLGGKRNSNSVITWVTGESMRYHNWASGQPDNSAGQENCIMMYRVPDNWPSHSLGKWNDISESGKYIDSVYFGASNFGFVCEWETLDPITTTPKTYTIHGR